MERADRSERDRHSGEEGRSLKSSRNLDRDGKDEAKDGKDKKFVSKR